ncbi:MAG: carboxypeptidase-like regulatory domain-containing protein, partial [Bacteroidia bacterium]|nr:carboxypeptidase-like regulatory domain-containing protein [Bacteroidia bacterium]
MRDAARHVATNTVAEDRSRPYRILWGGVRRYTLLGLLILMAGATFGQSLSVTGTVADSASGTPIEFASVVVHPSNDTAQVVKGVVCDLKGSYAFTLPAGEYRLMAQSLNYTPMERSITVPRMESDSTVTVNFSLTSSDIQIAAAKVEGSNQRVHLNRTEYTFTR